MHLLFRVGVPVVLCDDKLDMGIFQGGLAFIFVGVPQGVSGGVPLSNSPLLRKTKPAENNNKVALNHLQLLQEDRGVGRARGGGGEGVQGVKATCMNLYLSCSASARSHLLRHLSRLPPLPAV